MHAINKLNKLRQGNQLLKDFWSEFVTWKEFSSYNEVALVKFIQKRDPSGICTKISRNRSIESQVRVDTM